MGRLAVWKFEKVKREEVDLLITATFTSLKTIIRSTLKRVRIENEKKTPKYPRISNKAPPRTPPKHIPKKEPSDRVNWALPLYSGYITERSARRAEIVIALLRPIQCYFLVIKEPVFIRYYKMPWLLLLEFIKWVYASFTEGRWVLVKIPKIQSGLPPTRPLAIHKTSFKFNWT